MGGADFDLRTRQEGNHADVQRQPPFYLVDHFSADRSAFRGSLLEVFPDMPSVRALIGEENIALNRVARAVDHHVNDVAAFYGRQAVHLRKLSGGY